MANLEIENTTILNIADLFVENNPAIFLDKSAKLISERFDFNGFLILSLEKNTNKSFSTVFSHEGTPTSIVFEEEAFKSEFLSKEVLKIDHKFVDDIDDGDSSQKYDFFATSFGEFNKFGLVAIGFKDTSHTLKKSDYPFFSSICQILGINFQNISIIQEDSIKLTENFTKDSLTGLLNYKSFSESLDLATKSEGDDSFACIVIALDDFTAINSKYGFDLGNEVLFEIAIKLQNVVGNDDIVGRIGGDIFGIILKDKKSQENFSQITTRISNIFRKGLLPVGKDLTASIGITIFPEDSCENEDLIANAEIASKEAKKIPGTHSAFYKEIKLSLKQN